MLLSSGSHHTTPLLHTCDQTAVRKASHQHSLVQALLHSRVCFAETEEGASIRNWQHLLLGGLFQFL